MIRYALICPSDHRFESWFQSADAFDKLNSAAMVACPNCGATDVKKAIMAPRVRPARSAANDPTPAETPAPAPLTDPATPAEAALRKLKEHVEKNMEYVGEDFVDEARAIHDGDAPERGIYGEAKLEDAKALIEEGVEIAAVPIFNTRKTN